MPCESTYPNYTLFIYNKTITQTKLWAYFSITEHGLKLNLVLYLSLAEHTPNQTMGLFIYNRTWVMNSIV